MSHHSRAVYRHMPGADAARFLVDGEDDDPKQLMALLTGHGDEHLASDHPRNQGRR